METYVQKVQLEKYHTFLIFTATRFTKNDLLLAEKIRSMKKSFFFIRTKTDESVRAESRKRSFNEEAMLMKIRRDCAENLGDLLSNEEDIFLISNHVVDKWDFVRLAQAILGALTRYQRESWTLSLGKAITRSSEKIFQRKADVLKARLWMVAAAATVSAAIVPFPGFNSVDIDHTLILRELDLYRTEFGLPEEESTEYEKLNFATREIVQKVVSIRTVAQLSRFLAPYEAEATGKEVLRYVPVVGVAIASSMSYRATYYALEKLLGAIFTGAFGTNLASFQCDYGLSAIARGYRLF
ncbi:PREDICTED: interferon-inducible GTPase 1-like [Acropora digitifera]|uniref:interferon-inducible GTPase 1-like n=1 Tax=Acropora digitifera TaxID=70779 RepID=UPI00077A67B2|nr:PREDICTED: interferon-inducible GTPase 1-like [Acropora digitifera]